MTSKKDGCPLAHNHQSSSPKNKVSSAFEVPNKRDRGNDHANGDVNEGGHNNKASFKKGPWTAEEDALLIGYVQTHGERHWNCVQKTGLMRCGKSCRLRWTNHLRPDLKKGAFSPEEERIVLDLHAKLGNKWSKIAAEVKFCVSFFSTFILLLNMILINISIVSHSCFLNFFPSIIPVNYVVILFNFIDSYQVELTMR